MYISAGAHAESLIEAQTSEDPDIRITSPSMLLDQLAVCITHPTFFREQRENLNPVTIDAVRSRNTNELFAQVVLTQVKWHFFKKAIHCIYH